MEILLLVFFIAHVISKDIPTLTIPLELEPPKNQSFNAVRIQLGNPKTSAFNQSLDFQMGLDKFRPHTGEQFLLIKFLTVNLPINYPQCPNVHLNFFDRNSTSAYSFSAGCLNENQPTAFAIPDVVRLNMTMKDFMVDNPANVNSLNFIVTPIWTAPCPDGTIVCTSLTDLHVFESKRQINRFCVDVAYECPVGVFYNGTDLYVVHGADVMFAAVFAPTFILAILLLLGLIVTVAFCCRKKNMSSRLSKTHSTDSFNHIEVEADSLLEDR